MEPSNSKNIPIPIYYQIKEQLLDLISSGMLTEGDMLPSEEVWAKELKISRMTLRNALIQLVSSTGSRVVARSLPL